MKFLKRSQVLVRACSSRVHDAYAGKCHFLHAYIFNFLFLLKYFSLTVFHIIFFVLLFQINIFRDLETC